MMLASSARDFLCIVALTRPFSFLKIFGPLFGIFHFRTLIKFFALVLSGLAVLFHLTCLRLTEIFFSAKHAQEKNHGSQRCCGQLYGLTFALVFHVHGKR